MYGAQKGVGARCQALFLTFKTPGSMGNGELHRTQKSGVPGDGSQKAASLTLKAWPSLFCLLSVNLRLAIASFKMPGLSLCVLILAPSQVGLRCKPQGPWPL